MNTLKVTSGGFVSSTANGDFEYGTLIVDTIADLLKIDGNIFDKVHVLGYHEKGDGGGGIFYYDTNEVRTNHNGGTIISPSKTFPTTWPDETWFSDIDVSSGCWKRVYDGSVNVKWFGAKGDGIADDTLAIQKAILIHNNILIPIGIFITNTLDFVGIDNKNIYGENNQLSVIDFKLSSSNGLVIGYDDISGGSQYVTIRDLRLQASGTRLESLLRFNSGPTGQTPTQTSGFFTVENIFIDDNCTYGIVLDSISHFGGRDIYMKYQGDNEIGLYITNSININTGVFEFTNCVFRGQKHGTYVEANQQLVDTMTFISCGFFNYTNANAREAIYFKGISSLSSIVLNGCHAESRNQSSSPRSIVTFEGKVNTLSVYGSHFSGGEGADQTNWCDTCFLFKDTGNYKGITFNSIEVLRLKDKSVDTNSVVFRFEGTNSIFDNSYIYAKGIWRNSSIPYLCQTDNDNYLQYIDIEQDNLSGTRYHHSYQSYIFTLEDSATPSVIANNYKIINLSQNITDFISERYGQVISITNNSGADVTIEYNFYKIRTLDGNDIVLSDGKMVRFYRSPENHWVQLN